MARTDTLPHFLTDVADAIRTKTGSQETIQASSFDTAISNIPSGGGSIDLSTRVRFGYSEFTTMPSSITNANWSTTTDGEFMFFSCTALTTVPNIDTSAMTNMQSMFSDCISITTIPELDTSSCLNMYGIFSGCGSLTNESLNNVLAMCANVSSSYQGEKTLFDIGLEYSQAQICTGLSNYQDFLNAGWTLGDYEEEEPEE